MPTEPHLTEACKRGGNIDRVSVFAYLRKLWMEKNKTSALGDFCDYLGVHKSTASSYATGNDGRSPPWWVLLRLLAALRLEIRISEDGIVVGRRLIPRKKDVFFAHTLDGVPLMQDILTGDEVIG